MRDAELKGIGMTSRRTRDRLINRLAQQGIESADVLDVMRELPRHIFVDEALAQRAYEDTALPIGHNQTLSQPYIVARMTEALLADGPLNSVLEVGTGSGYQTAVLAQLVNKVYSVERIKPLQEKARVRLRRLAIRNAHLKLSDGTMGWPVMAPFDGIMATAAPGKVPVELLEQLSEDGGRLVIPVGDHHQELLLVVRHGQAFSQEVLEPVRFVPMLSGVVR
ncbi:protein-L-isoaspartate O-methyltransferase [Endozoicomonas montiporae]|uniref:Protein-L-isoaspartate O-methyltransferase n=2 Tax=Endozoicomonas montiporae TaxID=1027273 RepID=A0A081NBQ1_9GAMM|nr:protein-L-isoaspartate(D-aspartate) O-methyltransferase [Endozoicomonas montiporae]AMO56171.1 protein-L-isoaspartate(D-aspartate) O-methyltransferase [Endozoicomonas montiporae CL-33]KEQ15874.1 protein-L-isoaspartate O-methyltransferase [Endozoicomonas montiporae]